NTAWSSEKYDQLVKDANGKLLKKPEERNAAVKEAEELLLNDAPVAPGYQKGEAHLTNPQVKGLIYHQIGGDTSLKDVEIDKSIERETGKKKSTVAIIKTRNLKSDCVSFHFITIYLLRPNPIAFSIFFNVLNEAFWALSLPLSKIVSSSSELK